MAGSIETNTNAHKIYKYIAPAPPSQLIDTSVFVVDFQERKFVHIGVDPTNEFKVMIHIITPSRHIVISPAFLKLIFSQMGYILSIILGTPNKSTDNCIFINDSSTTLKKTVYRGENVLVVESLIHDGNRILLNQRDLMTIQYMEWSIYENVIYKTQIIAPMVFKQFLEISKYLESCFTLEGQKQLCFEEKINFIKSVHDEHIIRNIPKERINFVSQIKSFAVEQLATNIFPSDTYIAKTYYESLGGGIHDYTPLSQDRDADEDEDEAVKKLAIDVNDGPEIYNLRNMPLPTPPSPINFYSPTQLWRTL